MRWWYFQPLYLIYRYQIKEKAQKERTETIKINYKSMIANTSAIWQQLHIPPSNYHLLATQQHTYKKDKLLMKKVWEFCGKEAEKWTSSRKRTWRHKVQKTRQKNKRGDRKGDLLKWQPWDSRQGGGRGDQTPLASLQGVRRMKTTGMILVQQCSVELLGNSSLVEWTWLFTGLRRSSPEDGVQVPDWGGCCQEQCCAIAAHDCGARTGSPASSTTQCNQQ